MAKPIFIIEIPYSLATNNIHDAGKKIQDKISDWHVLLIPSGVKEVEYKAFAADKLQDIDIEALKQIVEEALKEIATKP